ncbi:MAG: glutaredoxin family protein [Alphaproteobacteria bacterium]|nr:glutaredoxin family protein [Alphaproteobacteria bacterium]
MRKIILTALCLFSFSAQAEIQFFTRKGCPFCQKAKEYITSVNSEEKFSFLDITQEENLKLFIECAKRFDLDERKLGIPLICAEKEYIMGWNEEKQEQLQKILSE